MIHTRPGHHGELDHHVVAEVYVHDVYGVRRLPYRPENIVDIGAHIGCFSVLAHEIWPDAKVAAVEVCPENIPTLTQNIGHFAHLFHAACTYEAGPLVLLNSVDAPEFVATGGSVVAPPVETVGPIYWQDHRPMARVTVEEVMALSGMQHIDLLKLDCEGSEFSILPNIDLGRVYGIVGEYHGLRRWVDILMGLFVGSEWVVDCAMGSDIGPFRIFRSEPFDAWKRRWETL